jgi:hypothetical protein
MTLHPDPEYQPIPFKAVIPCSLGTRSQRINPWIPADEPAASICKTEGGYQLKDSEIRPTRQMYRVLTGQEKKNHFALVSPSPKYLTSCCPESGTCAHKPARKEYTEIRYTELKFDVPLPPDTFSLAALRK